MQAKQSGVFLLLGSNLNDRAQNLTDAIHELSVSGEIALTSAVYETEPWGNLEQPAYLNQVIRFDTSLSPTGLLQTILDIEKRLGRTREIHWGPRTLDIDILYYNDLVHQSDDLQIPHPRLHLRRFTLLPLNDIAPDFIHPVLLQTNRFLLEICSDTSEVKIFESSRI